MEPIKEDEELKTRPIERPESTSQIHGLVDADAEATLYITVHMAKDLLAKDLNGL